MSRARTLSKLFNTDGNLNLSPVASINSEQVGGRRNILFNAEQVSAQEPHKPILVIDGQLRLDLPLITMLQLQEKLTFLRVAVLSIAQKLRWIPHKPLLAHKTAVFIKN